MSESTTTERVLAVPNLTEYFRETVDAVIDRQKVNVDPHAAHYVVNLLTLFSRSEDFYEDHGDVYGLRPLALMLVDAACADTADARSLSLQRIGDVALFVSGFFADSLSDAAVDIDYYIYMGENAYGSLSEEIRGTTRGDAFSHIYRELSCKFPVFVDVLNEIRDGTRSSSDVDLLRTYEIWMKTGSDRARKLLRENDIVPIDSRSRRRRH